MTQPFGESYNDVFKILFEERFAGWQWSAGRPGFYITVMRIFQEYNLSLKRDNNLFTINRNGIRFQ